jgi:hypothetical protein
MFQQIWGALPRLWKKWIPKTFTLCVDGSYLMICISISLCHEPVGISVWFHGSTAIRRTIVLNFTGASSLSM